MRSSNALAQDFKDKAVHGLEVARDKVVETTKDTGKKIDAHVHKRPWHYLGVAAFFSMFFGFFVGRKTKK